MDIQEEKKENQTELKDLSSAFAKEPQKAPAVKKKSALPLILTALCLVLLIAAGIVIWIVGSGPKREFNGYIDAAEKALSEKDYQASADNFLLALQMAPANREALNGYDRAYRSWSDSLNADAPELAAEVRDNEADELEALNENWHSGEIRRLVASARQAAYRYRVQDYNSKQPTPAAPQPTPYAQGSGSGSGYDYTQTNDPLGLLEMAYEYMSQSDYTSMMNVDGTDAADNVVSIMRNRGTDEMLYSPTYNGESDYTGEAVGVYIVPEGYYFFYGDYVNGVRNGEGTSFWVTTGAYRYEIYTGEWHDGKPNGMGAMYTKDDSDGTEITVTGNFTDGRQDGTMSYSYYNNWDNSYYYEEYEAIDGDAAAISLSQDEEDYVYGLYTVYLRLPNGTLVWYDSSSEYLAALGFRSR